MEDAGWSVRPSVTFAAPTAPTAPTGAGLSATCLLDVSLAVCAVGGSLEALTGTRLALGAPVVDLFDEGHHAAVRAGLDAVVREATPHWVARDVPLASRADPVDVVVERLQHVEG